jgi:hypothetical protein
VQLPDNNLEEDHPFKAKTCFWIFVSAWGLVSTLFWGCGMVFTLIVEHFTFVFYTIGLGVSNLQPRFVDPETNAD